MDRGEVVHAVKRAGGDHGPRAAGALFGRLEDEFDGAVQLRAVLHQQVRQPEADGGVAVVGAGMHHAAVAGGKAFPDREMIVLSGFIQIQRVHVDPKREGRPRAAGIQRGNNAGKTAFKGAEPFFRRTLLTRAGKGLGQGGIVGQTHAAVGIDHIAAHRQRVAQLIQYLCDFCRGAELHPA
ncbi:hypothetical protein D3C76_1157120 [compost metagenome]